MSAAVALEALAPLQPASLTPGCAGEHDDEAELRQAFLALTGCHLDSTSARYGNLTPTPVKRNAASDESADCSAGRSTVRRVAEDSAAGVGLARSSSVTDALQQTGTGGEPLTFSAEISDRPSKESDGTRFSQKSASFGDVAVPETAFVDARNDASAGAMPTALSQLPSWVWITANLDPCTQHSPPLDDLEFRRTLGVHLKTLQAKGFQVPLLNWFIGRSREHVAGWIDDVVLPWSTRFASTCDISGPLNKLASSVPEDVAAAAADFLRDLQRLCGCRAVILRLLGADEIQLARHRRQVQGQLLVHLPPEFERFVAVYTRTAFRAFHRAEPRHHLASSILRERQSSEPVETWCKARAAAGRLLDNTESRYAVDPDAGKYAMDLDAAAIYADIFGPYSSSGSDVDMEDVESEYESDGAQENEESRSDADEEGTAAEDCMEAEEEDGAPEQQAAGRDDQAEAEEGENEDDDGEECEDDGSQDEDCDVSYERDSAEGGEAMDDGGGRRLRNDARHVANFVSIYEALFALELYDFSSRVFLPVTFDEVAAVIRRTVRRPLDQGFAEWVRVWLRTVVNSWIGLHWAAKRGSSGAELAECVQWCARLEYFAYETLCELRVGQLWNTILDFPYSEEALLDLKWCLAKTGHRKELVQSLSAEFQRNLLHPGVETRHVLSQYVNCIKCLRILDPSGVLLDAVSGPIGAYLRCRTDTVKETIKMLLEDSNLGLGGSGDADGTGVLAHLDYDDDFAHPNWMPSPIDEPPTFDKRSRSADVVSLLVSIFKSATDVIKEFQSVLATTLLGMTGFDVSSQKRHLELLKMRFDKDSMQNCDVMLRDIVESRRINKNVKDSAHAANRPLGVLEAKIISKNFWPDLGDHPLILLPEVQKLMREHQRVFEAQKGARKLEWKASLGTVSVDMEFGGQVLKFPSIKPAEAVVIHHFQDQDTWQVVDLARATGLTMDVLRQTIGFWEDKQVLAPGDADRNTFVLTEGAARTAQ